jgi:hypothetical protein
MVLVPMSNLPTNDISRAQNGRYEKGAAISFKTLVKIIKVQYISIEEFFSEGFDDEYFFYFICTSDL